MNTGTWRLGAATAASDARPKARGDLGWEILIDDPVWHSPPESANIRTMATTKDLRP